jgi:hypothetical protein
MELIGIEWNRKISKKYKCEKCDVYTDKKTDYIRHCETIKHKTSILELNGIENIEKNDDTEKHKCVSCSRCFNTQSGLWKHNQKCKSSDKAIVDLLITQNKACTEENKLLREGQKELTEVLMHFLKEKDNNSVARFSENDFKNMIIDVLKASTVTNTMTNSCNTNSNNTTNNTFNLHFFLNETCKDALNLTDFIKTIQVGQEDIEKIGQVGYVDGISDVIIKKLHDLGIEKRPIHCTDAKRETVYVKENNEWLKEDQAVNFIQYLINEVQRINLRQLPKWREKHPTCLQSKSIHADMYNNMSQELMGGDCSKVKMQTKDNKIMKKIAKEMAIDKNMFLS